MNATTLLVDDELAEEGVTLVPVTLESEALTVDDDGTFDMSESAEARFNENTLDGMREDYDAALQVSSLSRDEQAWCRASRRPPRRPSSRRRRRPTTIDRCRRRARRSTIKCCPSCATSPPWSTRPCVHRRAVVTAVT